jgi:hypothetical protein
VSARPTHDSSAAAERARLAGACTLHLDVHPDNRRVTGALRRRLGPEALTWSQGLLSVDAPLAAVVALTRPTAAA